MKLALKFDKDYLPIFVFVVALIKVAYVAFMTFFVDVSNSFEDDLFYSRFITDGLAWMPLFVFFVYFYLYRLGKVSNIGLKYAGVCAILSIIPKLLLFAIIIYSDPSKNFWVMLYYTIELVTWTLFFFYLISLWHGHFRMRDEEHHHHHHHHSSHRHHDRRHFYVEREKE